MVEQPDIGVPRPDQLDEPIVIYTRPFCGYCTLAVRLLKQRRFSFREIGVGGNRPARAWLAEQSGQQTVPQIFIRGRSIGGYTELAVLDRRGQLLALVSG